MICTMRPTKSLLSALLILACSTHVLPVHACDTEKTATPDSTCVITERNGRKGVWYDIDTADNMRKEYVAAPMIRNLLDQYKQHASTLQLRADALEDETISLRLALTSSKLDTVDAKLEAERLKLKLDAANSPWRSPWVLVPLGVVVGSAATAVVVIEVHSALSR